MGSTARDQTIELPIPWTDRWGREHQSVKGNPVALHAMRGLAAHRNGFQTTRALAILMSLLGTIDRPGGFRHKAPYPRAVPPNARPPKGTASIKPNTPLDGPPLDWIESPADLCIDDDGEAVRCGAVRCGAVRCGAVRCGSTRTSAGSSRSRPMG